jgi:hypothetical protein
MSLLDSEYFLPGNKSYNYNKFAVKEPTPLAIPAVNVTLV